MLTMTDESTDAPGQTVERKTLRDWRLARDMTVAELAQAAGISESTVWEAESGRRAPRFPTLAGLARALDIRQEQIIWPALLYRPPRNKGVRRGPLRREEEPSE